MIEDTKINTKKIIKIAVIILIVSVLSLFFAEKKVFAYGAWQGNSTSGMPQKGAYAEKGSLLPNVLQKRTFSGDADTDFPYASWSTEVSGTTMYGADSNTSVRFGKYDSKKYYPTPYVNDGVGYYYVDFLSKMKDLCEERARNYFSGFTLADLIGAVHGAFGLKYEGCVPLIWYDQIQGPSIYNNELYSIDSFQPMLITRVKSSSASSTSGYDYSKPEELTRRVIIAHILTKLTNWDKPEVTQDGSTNMNIWETSLDWRLTRDPVLGPKVAIMETENRAGNGYKQEGNKKTYNNLSTNIKGANMAYILTAMENAYSGVTNSIRTRYSLSDIQTAYWEAKDFSLISSKEETQNGKELFKKAKSYQKFVNTNLYNYSAQLDMSQSQIVTNRSDNKYIIGPITINYPEYEDISYLKSIYLKTNEGEPLKSKTLVYDENTDDFEIECIGRTVSGSNGLKKKYPASGSQFYIKFSASDTLYPTNVGVYADLEYLRKAEIEYNELRTKTNIYQYIGLTARASDSSSDKSDKKLRLARGQAFITVKYSYTQTRVKYVLFVPVVYFTTEHGTLWLTIHNDDTYMIAQPFVQMTKDPVDEIDAQPIDAVMGGKREYNVYHLEYHKNNIKLPTNPGLDPNKKETNVDLTMKISGKVWQDNEEGKENKYDGKNGDGDTPMSNVKVTLYEVPKTPTLPSDKPKPELPPSTDPEEPKKPTITSNRYLIYNRKTGETLMGKNQNRQCSVASVTKIATALVVAERANLDDVVTVSKNAVGTTLRKQTWSPQLQIVGLEEGDKVTVRDLLRSILVYSGCDAAVALAEHVAGSQAAFVNLMNTKVRSLGLGSTHFVTPYGVNANDKSSAMDLSKLLDAAMDNSVFNTYFKEGANQSITITITRNGHSFKKSLYSTNPLKTTAGIEGTKTGMIGAAGYCVIASFKYENEEYAIVVLGAKTKEQRNVDARKLAQWLLEKIEYEKRKAGKSDSTGSTGTIGGGIIGGITDVIDFKEKGRFFAATTTDENGDYVFYNLNSMYNYYVKFTYNGQYYEPTKYNAKRDDENWDNNSKGLDVASQRNVFNAKFRDIGSAPANLLKPEAEMHTRKELEEQGIIDKFGNIVGEVGKDGTRTSKDTYVNESMMDSYTCNGTGTMDLYPNVDVFVNAEKKHSLLETSQILQFIGSNDIKTLYADPDIMRHVNQGFVQREIVDLALRKDVYKATLEINGEVEEYTYDKRNSVVFEGCWDIKGRNELGYYNQNYTRELYREDYSYKVEDYTNFKFAQDLLGLSEDSELKVFVTYRFTIRNSSTSIATAVTEVVDYYDPDFKPVPERSYLGDKDGKSIGAITLSEKSRYADSTMKKMNEYGRVYVTGSSIYSGVADDIQSTGCFPLSDPDKNKDVYFYVTFEVKKDSNRNILLDNDSGKENVAEINGYKSYYGERAVAPNLGNTQTQPEFTKGDIAGIPDTDSTPGNLRQIDTSKFEDDTDKAPNIKITLNYVNERAIKGTVWEDKRTEEVNNAMVGNGKRDDGEVGVNGVRVQLVEIKEKSNGEGVEGTKYEYIWKEVKSGMSTLLSQEPVIPRRGNASLSDLFQSSIGTGEYLFRGMIPGNYIVRFIYGSTEETVLSEKSVNYRTGEIQDNPVTAALGYNAVNEKSYNGQDYKSTSYQVESTINGIGAYRNTTSGSYMYNYEEDGKNQSDAKDIMRNIDYSSLASIINSIGNWRLSVAKNPTNVFDSTHTREDVEGYSNGDVTNKLAEILASYEHLPSDENNARDYLNTFMKNTYMVAETGIIEMKSEYNREESTTTPLFGAANIGTNNYDRGGYYVLEGLDFGLVERPKAQLKVTKQIINVKMTLANNNVLFDAIGRATNVLWMGHTAHGRDTGNTYTTNKNYKNNMMLTPIVRANATNKGKVQLTMDQEVMHGATLQITYAITVANTGEVDYKEDKFYYTGNVGDTSTIVKTNPRKLIDYVGTQVYEDGAKEDNTGTRNNLQFSKQLNTEWNVISNSDVTGQGLVNGKYENSIKEYTKDHIIVTDAVSKELKPIIVDQANATQIAKAFKDDPMHALDKVNNAESVSGVQLILTQMITQDSKNDDHIYNNMTELVTTKNPVGRKMAYSIVGNQDPTREPYEIDADDSQEVLILPPFGNTHIFYILGGAVALILIVGITATLVILKKKK